MAGKKLPQQVFTEFLKCSRTPDADIKAPRKWFRSVRASYNPNIIQPPPKTCASSRAVPCRMNQLTEVYVDRNEYVDYKMYGQIQWTKLTPVKEVFLAILA